MLTCTLKWFIAGAWMRVAARPQGVDHARLVVVIPGSAEAAVALFRKAQH